MKTEQSVPKRWHIRFRRWGITQKKAYNDGIFTSTGKLAQRYGNHYTEVAQFAKIYQHAKII